MHGAMLTREVDVVTTFTYDEYAPGPCNHDPSSPLVHVCEHEQPTGRKVYVLEGREVSKAEYEAAVG